MKKTKKQCQILDSDGNQCKNKASARIEYHGDPEIYSAFDEVRRQWVRIWVCKEHSGDGG